MRISRGGGMAKEKPSAAKRSASHWRLIIGNENEENVARRKWRPAAA
jgi:hypothetical protein